MQFLLDNLMASLIALALVVLLIAMQTRVQQVSADRAALYAAKKQTLEFADVLTRELSNLGAHMPESKRIGKRTVNAYGLTDTLQFWRVDTNKDTLNISYVLVPADTVVLRDTVSTVLYRMLRYQNGQLRGGSTPTLQDFRIELLNNFGGAVGTDMAAVRQVRIRLSNVIPYDDPDRYYISQTYWGTTLRPRSLW